MEISAIKFSDSLLLEVLALSKDATAVYDTADLHIRFANDAMIAIWGKSREVVGKTFEEAIPEIVGQPFTDLLKNTWHSGETYRAIDTPADLKVNGKLQTFYFDFEYRPLRNERGETFCILHTATDVTERVTSRKNIREYQRTEARLNHALEASNRDLSQINEELTFLSLENKKSIEQLALAKQATHLGLFDFDLVNNILEWDARCRELFGADPEKDIDYHADFVGGLHPEDRERAVRAVEESYDYKYSGGRYEIAFRTVHPQNKKITWVQAIGQVYFNASDQAQRFIGTVRDITAEKEAQLQLQQNESRLQEANEELFAINEEQTSVNEELRAAYDDLAHAQHELEYSKDKVTESENRLRSLLEQAPLGLCVLSGPEHVIEIANDRILKIWGRKGSDVIGKPHHLARPELIGQPVFEWLDTVYNTGTTKKNDEFKVLLYEPGGLREAIVNSIYQPIKNAQGETIGVMVMLDEVTDKIKARQEAFKVQEMFNLAVEAGELATYYYNPVSNLFTGNDLLKQWFGLSENDYIDLDIALAVMAPDDRSHVTASIIRALDYRFGGVYEEEYTIINPRTQERRIVRAKGRTFFDKNQRALSLNGTLQDITARKRDEQRKDDFIAMVSHELKTPLTSVNAYIQMLQAKAERNLDSFTAGALDKTARQVKKMTRMINGFLNVSRLESGNIHLQYELFQMSSLFAEIEEETHTTISSHNIIFHPSPDIQLYADKDKVGQVLSNLVSNAVKYSPAQLNVEVSCSEENGFVVVRVKDKGIGILEEDKQRLFDRYYRVSDNQTHTISGFGIGLYLSAEIIRLHKGHIGVHSDYGKGSEFFFSIPQVASPLNTN